MIDIMRTILASTDEYEMRYGKHPVLFINRAFYKYLMTNELDIRYYLCFGLDKMTLCGYPAKLVQDDSDEMHFWIGEQKPIYGKENYNG